MTKVKDKLRVIEAPEKLEPMTEAEFRMFIKEGRWLYAKTMPQWPHEYVVRRATDSVESQILFLRAAAYIRAHGEKRAFKPSRSKFIYLDIDGRQYWTMGAPLSNTIILNRAWLNWEDRLEAGEDPESIAKNDPPQRQAESA